MSGTYPFYRKRAARAMFSVATVCVIAMSAVCALRGARAQDAGSPAGGSKEMQSLLLELADIDTMHALAPLKLTGDQAGRLAAAITSARTDYDTKVNALGSAPLMKMADEIHTTRKNAIAGAAVPKDFDDRVKAIEKDFVAKREQINQQNIVKMGTAAKAILTADQVATAGKLEKGVLEKQGNYNPQTTGIQLFNAYVVDVLIDNPRTAPLLQEIKAAAH